MKNFYEMIQILNSAKVNEGRKYLAYYDSSEEINIGERVDYYSWEGVLKIGYERNEDDRGREYLFPVAWGIEGSLIKFKEDKDGQAIVGEDGKLVVDKEFENPGVHGQNIPEPYKSGSTEITGFDEVINIILKGLLKDINGAISDPKHYDWQEFDGTMHEEPDILAHHHKVIKYGDKEITLGKVHDYSPRQLPWYRNPDAIPPEELEEAKRVARQETTKRKGDQKEYEWRLKTYINARTGLDGSSFYGYSHEPWHVMDHDHALEHMTKYCLHDWVKDSDHHTSNKYLGTWESGINYICKKCGEKRYERTAYNNWSGD